MNYNNFFGALLLEKRDARKLEYADVGDMIGQEGGNIRRIEKGERVLMLSDLLILIEKLWGGIEHFVKHMLNLYVRLYHCKP